MRLIFTQEDTVKSQNSTENSRATLHVEVQKAITEDWQPWANELPHGKA